MLRFGGLFSKIFFNLSVYWVQDYGPIGSVWHLSENLSLRKSPGENVWDFLGFP